MNASFKSYFKLNKPGARKRTKYKSASCTCRQGHVHASGLEARTCDTLHLMMRAKDSTIVEIKQQATFHFVVNGHHICSHKPDFLLTHKDGTQSVVEAKGFPDKAWPIKHALFLALYPNIPYEIWRK